MQRTLWCCAEPLLLDCEGQAHRRCDGRETLEPLVRCDGRETLEPFVRCEGRRVAVLIGRIFVRVPDLCFGRGRRLGAACGLECVALHVVLLVELRGRDSSHAVWDYYLIFNYLLITIYARPRYFGAGLGGIFSASHFLERGLAVCVVRGGKQYVCGVEKHVCLSNMCGG